MKKNLLKILNAPWYFVPFAAYPVLALLSYNISQVRYTAGIRPLIISVAAAVLLFLLFRLIYKDWHRAAFATAVFTVLFYTYGQVFDQIQKKWKVPNLPIWLGVLWLVLLCPGAGLGRLAPDPLPGRRADVEYHLAWPGDLCGLARWSRQSPADKQSDKPADPHAPVQTLHIPDGQTPPDIYYIILDSYGRSDLLASNLQYDNSAFISDLEKMGFYVARLQPKQLSPHRRLAGIILEFGLSPEPE